MLSLKTIREANMKRLPLFKNAQGGPAHSKPDGSDWSIDMWFQALIGEVGEYANLRKKWSRGDFTDVTEYRQAVGRELADTLLYLDLLMFQYRVCWPDDLTISHFSSTTDYRTPEEGRLRVLVRHLNDLPLFTSFEDSLSTICILAKMNGIENFSGVVREKFNEVSERVKAPVFIVGDSVVVLP